MDIPYFARRRGLPDDLVARVLDHAAAEEANATPSPVYDDDRVGTVDPGSRIALDVPAGAALEAAFRSVTLDLLPDACAAIGVRPFAPTHFEVSFVAHGDGAFFERHIDTFTGARPAGEPPRMVTFVCYAFREPKQFTGGALRLFDVRGEQFVDIEPESGLVVAFPSWSLHEVRRVSCPGCAFRDYRFGINVWVGGSAWRLS